MDESSALDEDAELFAAAVAATDFPELAAARAHLARLRLRVRPQERGAFSSFFLCPFL
jgi:hypothetical protein